MNAVRCWHISRRLVSCLSVALVCLIGLSLGARQSVAAEGLAAVSPSGAVAFLEISDLEPWIEKLQKSALVAGLPTNPQVQAFYQSPPGKKADAGRKLVETQLGMDLWTLGKTLFGGRIGVALYPHDGRKEPDAVVIVQVKDVASLTKIRERLDPLLVLIGDQTQATPGPAGSTLRNYDGKLFVADKDNWIALASTSDLMGRTVGLLTGTKSPDQKSLSDDAPFLAMTKQMGSQHLARGYVNLQMIAQGQGGRLGPEKLDNPVLSLLNGGVYELANRSPFWGLSLDIDNQHLRFVSEIAGKAESLGDKYRSMFADANVGAASLPNIPGLIGGWSLHRDFSGWYKRREDLLDAKVLPEFDKFESGLANLLPSRDFGEDILPALGRNLTFVIAPQSYSHLDGKPGVQVPAAALIVDLAKPDEGTEVLTLFFQTISAIANLNAGQQGRQPWVLASETYKDVQITFGKYGQKPKGDRLPIVFNFMPAAARMGNKYFICSSVELCRQLIDAYSTPAVDSAARKPANHDFLLQLSGDAVAKALDVNRELFEARSIQGGKSSEQARAELDFALQLIRGINSLRITTGLSGDGYQFQIEALWK